MNNGQRDMFVTVLQNAVKQGVENRHRALVLYLKELNGSIDGYGSRSSKGKREEAIAAFAEFEREASEDYAIRSISDENYFEKFILDLWFQDGDAKDERSAMQRVIDGDTPQPVR